MLDRILASKKEEVANMVVPPKEETVKRSSFVDALKNPNRSLALIAEIKRASPSKGIINDNIDPVEVALSYEKAGADAISVLTDTPFFKGTIEDLIKVKQSVSIPILRKDFIIDKRQIDESAAIGADAILLIVKALGPEKTYHFYQYAAECGLDCLVEVHEEAELKQLVDVFVPKVIGVNNRNLSTFHTSLDMTDSIAKLVPKDTVFISESGIHSSEDIERVKRQGAKGVLVGEALMKAETPEIGIRQLFEKERIAANES
ncbi:indole-3-glycerol phosphate synthase TrpC [Pueribacillus theae]|uniref:Indole-3-glycerol phosphate synthase n=1 Tax=Pueribacillus theae TaxID=2171751 RepID=A0A2U1K4B6_9BACI|nr:indole-3-glycerol phosphate synthase TrpC [Pueribacillus theae]PWA12367.1 indole-3-glycerol phosphate synthase TrpC [Pueribacillus theae]